MVQRSKYKIAEYMYLYSVINKNFSCAFCCTSEVTCSG